MDEDELRRAARPFHMAPETKDGFDLVLIRENLALTPEQRVVQAGIQVERLRALRDVGRTSTAQR